MSFFSPVEFLDAEVHAVSIRHVSQLVHDRLVGQPVRPASSLVGSRTSQTHLTTSYSLTQATSSRGEPKASFPKGLGYRGTP